MVLQDLAIEGWALVKIEMSQATIGEARGIFSLAQPNVDHIRGTGAHRCNKRGRSWIAGLRVEGCILALSSTKAVLRRWNDSHSELRGYLRLWFYAFDLAMSSGYM